MSASTIAPIGPVTEAPAPGRAPIRALIAELAHVEDQVRELRTATSTVHHHEGPVLNPELMRLLRREADIVSAIRRAAATLRA